MTTNQHHRFTRRQRRYKDDPPPEDDVGSVPSPTPSFVATEARSLTNMPTVELIRWPSGTPSTNTSISPTTDSPTSAPTPEPTGIPPCLLDPETGTFGHMGGEDDDVTSGLVSFVYQVVTEDESLKADTLRTLETYMTEQMIESMMTCYGKDYQLPSTGSGTLPEGSSSLSSSSGLSRKRRKPRDDITRQLQSIHDDNITSSINPFVGLSSEPLDLTVSSAEIRCTGSYRRGHTYCVVVEGQITVAIDQTATDDLKQTEVLYRDAIRSAVEDTNTWVQSVVGSPDDVVEITYRGDSRDYLGSFSDTLLSNPGKFKEYWIPGVTIFGFFLILVIVFIIQDANSPLKKEWEEQRLKRDASGGSGSGEEDDEQNAAEDVRLSSSFVAPDDSTAVANGDSGASIVQGNAHDEQHQPLTRSEP